MIQLLGENAIATIFGSKGLKEAATVGDPNAWSMMHRELWIRGKCEVLGVTKVALASGCE